MNDTCLAEAEFKQRAACAEAASRPAGKRPASALGGLLLALFAAPFRLHHYRNLNTRLVRDAFCLRDCWRDADD